ncbi:MAG: MMPL family transporter [Acidobacteriota bacterium]|nr:MMPL family transporter [Acidobacteriota bacterium]
MLITWSQAAVKFRSLVLTIWIALAAFGIFGASHLDSYLTTSLEVPGSSSAAANTILNEKFKENTEGTFTVMYKYKQASTAQIEGFKTALRKAAAVIPGSEITQEKAFAGTLYANIGTPFDLKDAAKYTDDLRAALKSNGLNGSLVSGPPAIESDVVPILSTDLHRGQLVAVVLAAVLLVATLGFTWAVFIPLIFGFVTISTTLGIIYLLAHKFLMVLYVPNIVELIGLGLAIDYSLLMVSRYRREVNTAKDPLVETMKTAGKTAIISGATVALGLSTLLLVPVPFVRSLGLACLILPLISIAAAITLQPILLSILGKPGNAKFKGLLNFSFDRFTEVAIKRPRVIFTSSLAILAALMSALMWFQVTPSSLSAIPSHLESAQALNTVTSKVGVGVITPSEIVIDLGPTIKAQDVADVRFEFVKRIAANKEVFTVANGEKWPYIDSTGRYLRIYVFGNHDLGSTETRKLVTELRNTYIPKAGFPNGTKFYLGGAPAQGIDLLDAISTSLPLIITLILLITFLVLLRTFRSIVLALKAIILDLISIAVSFAVLVLVFRFGIGTYQLEQLEAWVLVLLFAVLFGLSMDYEIFIVSRMREAWDRGAGNEESIREGMRNSGTVVTASALIFISALTGLISGHFAGLQQLGVGLAAGVLIDATVIRGLLLPSAMVLLGKWNWWMPGQRKTPPLD